MGTATHENKSHVPRYGYWDASWTRSQFGRLTLVAQAADYGGNLRAVYASPPSLIVDLPGLALTAYAGAEERKRILLSGFQLHVPKPIEPAELAAVVASLAGHTAGT